MNRKNLRFTIPGPAGMQLFLGCIIICILIMAIPGRISSKEPLRKLTVQLKWYHQAQFAGFYLAREEGYYRSKGLDVRFVEGGPHIDWQKKFTDERYPVGITNAYEIAIARAKGVPVVAVAVINQASPIVWFSLTRSGITDPRQFRGKKVVLVPTGKAHFMGMMKKVGVPLSEIDIKLFSQDLAPLYNGEVDVWSGYHTNLVTKAEQEGYELNLIHPIDYGIQIYDDVIYVRESLLEESPDTVRGFLEATFKGWFTVMRAQDRGIEYSLKYSKEKNRENLSIQLSRTIPYIHTGEVPIGWMERSVWEEICILIHHVGLTDTMPPVGSVFTNRFLLDIYGEDLR